MNECLICHSSNNFIDLINIGLFICNKKKNSFEIVREMGIGNIIGNTFDSFSYFNDLETPDE